MIIVGLMLFPLDPWTQLITIALGCLISRVRPKSALVAPGLIFFTAYGFLKHIPRDLRVSKPTSSLNHSEVKLLLAFFIFMCSAFIYLHRNALAFSYLLLSLILVACHLCKKRRSENALCLHAAHWMRKARGGAEHLISCGIGRRGRASGLRREGRRPRDV